MSGQMVTETKESIQSLVAARIHFSEEFQAHKLAVCGTLWCSNGHATGHGTV